MSTVFGIQATTQGVSQAPILALLALFRAFRRIDLWLESQVSRAKRMWMRQIEARFEDFGA